MALPFFGAVFGKCHYLTFSDAIALVDSVPHGNSLLFTAR